MACDKALKSSPGGLEVHWLSKRKVKLLAPCPALYGFAFPFQIVTPVLSGWLPFSCFAGKQSFDHVCYLFMQFDVST